MSDETGLFLRSTIRFRRFATTNQTHYLKSKGGVIFGSISREVFFFRNGRTIDSSFSYSMIYT